MGSILAINDLRYSYSAGKRRYEVLRGITLEVKKGEVFGFIGPNGAGKTTTIKHILGIIPDKNKSVSVLGSSPSKSSSRTRIGYMPENAVYYGFLSPVELLEMYGEICSVDRSLIRERTRKLIDMVGLSRQANKPLNTFSKGMMQKVSFAQALINDPEFLVLDEPTGGLDPIARKNMRKVISDLRGAGKTVFFSSHELSEVELVADRIGVIDKGKIVAMGNVAELLGGKLSGQTLENYFLQLIGEQE